MSRDGAYLCCALFSCHQFVVDLLYYASIRGFAFGLHEEIAHEIIARRFLLLGVPPRPRTSLARRTNPHFDRIRRTTPHAHHDDACL